VLHNQVAAVVGIGLIACLFVVFYKSWQTSCADVARHKIFEARAELFDMAAKGMLDFQSAEYRNIRRTYESVIRYAHWISWPNMAFVSVFAKPSQRSIIADCMQAIDDPATRAAVARLNHKVARAVWGLMIERSILLLLIAGALALFYRPQLRALKSRPTGLIEQEALKLDALCVARP
jgi:hypothetical protein